MARFKSILGEIRGSIAGTTFSRNGNSAYARSRAIPVNPRSPGQTISRANLAYISALWRTLTQAQQDAWKSLAQTVPYTNSVGESSFYSGFQLFVKLNQVLLASGVTEILNAPAGAPAFPAILFNNPSAEQDGVDPSIFSLSNAYVITGSGVGFQMQTEATVIQSAGRNFVNKSDYRRVTSQSPVVTSNPNDLTTNYEAVFGAPTSSVIGSAIFLRMRVVDLASGFTTPWVEQKVIVAEA